MLIAVFLLASLNNRVEMKVDIFFFWVRFGIESRLISVTIIIVIVKCDFVKKERLRYHIAAQKSKQTMHEWK